MKANQTIFNRLPDALLPWYAKNARVLPWRGDRDPYHVWLSEIMLQQTRVEAVLGYYTRFLEQLPTLRALAEAEESKLLKLWEGLGYYSRARNLQKAARIIVTQYDGRFPEHYSEIRALPGVGPYTAGAIASICFELPCAAVDGNVLRVISRITESRAPIDKAQTRTDIAARLEEVYPPHACGSFTQALMELGAVVCTPKAPKCADCPARSFCLAHRHGAELRYPVKAPKKEKRLETRTVLLLQCGDAFALTKRAERGLLSGLWQLPNLDGELDPAQAIQAADTLQVRPLELCRQMRRTHVFTHIKWQMTGYHILCAERAATLTWATADELKTVYALPTAFRLFLEEK